MTFTLASGSPQWEGDAGTFWPAAGQGCGVPGWAASSPGPTSGPPTPTPTPPWVSSPPRKIYKWRACPSSEDPRTRPAPAATQAPAEEGEESQEAAGSGHSGSTPRGQRLGECTVLFETYPLYVDTSKKERTKLNVKGKSYLPYALLISLIYKESLKKSIRK